MAYSPTRALTLGVSAQTQALVYRELATLLNTGIPLNQALEQASHTGPPHFQSALKDLAQYAAQGNLISGRMREYGRIFHPVVPAIVGAGEQTGLLAESFATLAEFFEAEAEIIRTVRQASIYPTIVAVVAVLAVIILATVPGYIMMKSGMQPMNFMGFGIAKLLGFIALIIAVIWLLLRFRTFQKLLRYPLMLMPYFGGIMRSLAVSRFCQTLGVLIRAGVPYLEALETTQPTIQHPEVERAAQHVYSGVRNGGTLEESIRRQPAFPPTMRNLVAAGEAAGTVDETLIKSADYLRTDAKYKIKNATKLMGPVLIIVLGIIVGFVLISFWRGYFEMIFTLAE